MIALLRVIIIVFTLTPQLVYYGQPPVGVNIHSIVINGVTCSDTSLRGTSHDSTVTNKTIIILY